MARYSKSILASFVLAAAFNLSAHAEVSPRVESNPMDEHAFSNEWWADKEIHGDIFESSLLSDAIMHGKRDVFEHLLSLETETRKWPAQSLGYAMSDAIQFNQPAILKTLIEKKGKATPVEYKNSALQMMAYDGDLETIKLLHKAGADIQGDDNLALLFAARKGHLSVVKYLMESGASALHSLEGRYFPGFGPFGALSEAATHGQKSVVRYMIEQQHVLVNIRGKDGRFYSPALAECFYRGNTDMVEFLFDHGAVSVGPDNGEGVLAIAVRKSDWDMVRTGLAHGMTLTNTYRHFSQHTDIYARPLAELKNFMEENNIPLPAAARVNYAPSP